MNKIKHLINERNKQYEQHAFIQYLKNKDIPPEQRLSYLPYAVYFVLTFADVNRFLLPDHSHDDPIQNIINTHGEEDGKHWAWFLHDIEVMGYNQNLSFTEATKLIWSNESVQTRKFCYTLIQVCLNANSLLKLVIIESLEAMGKLWLDNSVAVSREMNCQEKLIYLGQHHNKREVGHAMGTKTDEIENIILPSNLRLAAEKIVYQLFDGMEAFNQEILQRAQQHTHNQYVSGRQSLEKNYGMA